MSYPPLRGGTRVRMLTDEKPKMLAEINNNPLIKDGSDNPPGVGVPLTHRDPPISKTDISVEYNNEYEGILNYVRLSDEELKDDFESSNSKIETQDRRTSGSYHSWFCRYHSTNCLAPSWIETPGS